MPLTDDELLASNPDAAGLIAAGVPREEVLQGLRTDSSREEEPVHVVQPIARMASIQRGSAPLPPGWEERFQEYSRSSHCQLTKGVASVQTTE